MKKEPYSRLEASRLLSMYKISGTNDFMKYNVIWCREAFAYPSGWNDKCHWHSFYEMHCVMNGEMTYIIYDDAGEYRNVLKAGQFILIPPRVRHQTPYCSDDLSRFMFAFEADITTDTRESRYFSYVLRTLPPNAVYWMNANDDFIINRVLEEAFHGQPFCEQYISSLLQCFMIGLVRTICPVVPQNLPKLKNTEKNSLVEQVEQYIEKNISRRLLAEDIAQYFCMNKDKLNQMIKKTRNISLAEMITAIRLKKAKSLLETTRMQLKEIAQLVGFSSEYNFIRFFKQKEGLPPGKYRSSLEE